MTSQVAVQLPITRLHEGVAAGATARSNAAEAMPDTRLQQGDASRAAWQMKALRLALRVVFSLLFRVRSFGMENLPQRNAILCGNHLGWAEGFMGLLFLPVEPRMYVLGERHVVYGAPWQTRLINWLGIFVPVNRENPLRTLRTLEDVIRRGGSLILAPEGHLGNQEGTIAPLQPGAAYVSQRTGAPLVPVGVTGTLEVWLRCTLTMRIGRPIFPDEFSGDIRTRTDGMTARLERDMRALLPGDVDRPRWKPLRGWLTKLF